MYDSLLIGHSSIGELGDLAKVSFIVVEVFTYGLIRDLTIIVTDLSDSLKDSSIFL